MFPSFNSFTSDFAEKYLEGPLKMFHHCFVFFRVGVALLLLSICRQHTLLVSRLWRMLWKTLTGTPIARTTDFSEGSRRNPKGISKGGRKLVCCMFGLDVSRVVCRCLLVFMYFIFDMFIGK